MSEQGKAEVLDRGTFRLDRRRALEKIEKFQLEDPRRYVLELMAAAVLSGATSFELSQDADDCVLSWDGEAPSGEALDSLFDHLFGEPSTPQAAMLQHLGVGLLGALGLKTESVRVEAGDGEKAVVLTLNDLADTRHQALSPPIRGVRCHIRERIGHKLLMKGLALFFRDPDESALVRGAALRFPLPVRINGKEQPRLGEPGAWAAQLSAPEGQLWLVPQSLGGSLDILRHGLVVDRVDIKLGEFQVVGVWRRDSLRLNASRSGVVQDEQQNLLLKELGWATERLALHLLEPVVGEDLFAWTGQGEQRGRRFSASRSELIEVALPQVVRAMQLRGALPPPLRAVPLISDCFGRRWTVQELLALPRPPGWLGESAADPELDRAQFPSGEQALLSAIRADSHDLELILKARALGRERQRVAPRMPKDLGQTPSRRFEEGGLRGELGFGPPEQLMDSVVTRLGLRGREVQRRSLPAPGLQLVASLEHDSFRVNDSFTEVLEDQVFKDAVARLVAEGEAFLLFELARAPGSEQMFSAFTSLIRSYAKGRLDARSSADDWRLVLSPKLLDAPAFLAFDGRRLTLTDVLNSKDSWYVLAPGTLGVPSELAPRVLSLSPKLAQAWARLLGDRLDVEAKALAASLERARRLALPRRTPSELGTDVQRTRAFRTPQVFGVIGWRESAQAEAQVSLLCCGVWVQNLSMNLDLPGLVIELDWSAAPVNAAYDALLPKAELELRGLLTPEVDALALEIWDQQGLELGEALCAWLRSARVMLNPPPGALTRPLGRRQDGGIWTLGDLSTLKRTRKKGDPRLTLLTRDPGGLPGFDRAIRVSPQARLVVTAWGPELSSLRDPELAEAEARQARFLEERPRWVSPQPVLARIAVQGQGWQGELLLPADPTLIGRLRVMVLWKDRLLTERSRAQPLGGLLVVAGEALGPSRAFDNVQDPSLTQPLVDKAIEALDALLEQAWTRWGPQRLDLYLDSWRALLAGMMLEKGRGRRPMLSQLSEVPLFTTLDGRRLSLQALRAAKDQGARWFLVAANTPPGPSDHTHYLLDAPGTRMVLSAAFGEAPEADEPLARWRALRRRAEAWPRREPVLRGEWVLRAPLELPKVVGELGVSPGEGALIFQPLVMGIELAPIRRTFPVRAEVVMQGEGVEADRMAEHAVESGAFQALLSAASAQVERTLQQLAAQPSTEAERDLCRQYVLCAADPGDAQKRPLFPLADGTLLSLEQLRERYKRDQGLMLLARAPETQPPGLSPVLAGPALRALFSTRFRLVDLEPFLENVQRRSPRSPVAGLGEQRWGVVEADLQRDVVELRLGQQLLARISPGGPLPLLGWVQDPALKPSPLWDGVVQDEALQALTLALRGVSELKLAACLATPEDPNSQPLLRVALLRLTPDEKRLKACIAGEGPAAALAQAPLFETSQGARLSLAQLSGLGLVRAVAPGSRGEAAPGMPPFIWLRAEERTWLSQALPLEDAQQALGEEALAALRRAGAPTPKPKAPLGAATRTFSGEGVTLSLWLGGLDPGQLLVLVKGVKVQDLPVDVPGLRGWLDGELPTNPAFTEARLPAALLGQIRALALELWRQEAEGGVESHRLALARVHELKLPLKALLDKHPELADLAPLRDTEGKSVSLGRVQEELRAQKVLLWVAPETLPPIALSEELMVLSLSPLELDLMGVLVGVDRLMSAGLYWQDQLLKGEKKRVEKAKKRAKRDLAPIRAAMQQIRRELGEDRLFKNSTLKRWEQHGLPAVLDPEDKPRGLPWLAAWEAGFGEEAQPLPSAALELEALRHIARALR